MTPIKKILTTDNQQQFRREAKAALATLAVVASLSLAWYSLQSDAAQDHEMERIMRAACRLPDINGAVTIFTMRDGKLECGRYQ